MTRFAQRVRQLKPSASVALNARVLELKQQGHKVFNFTIGEPDFDTPDTIKQAARTAIDEGFTKYTPAAGIKELKQAICRKFKDENNLEYSVGQVAVSSGAKQALYNIFQVLLNGGDEVIVPSPYWFTYEEQVKLAGGQAVFCLTGSDFKLTAEAVAACITPRTKILVLNSPNNPTGAIIEPEELQAIAMLAVQHNIYVISDEVYEHFIYDGRQHQSIAALGKDIFDITLTVNAVSKTYAMTGWRLGWVAGPPEIIKTIGSLQSHSANPSSISQKAALAALAGRPEVFDRMIKEFGQRRQYVYEQVSQLPGLSCHKPEGTFYAFIDATEIIQKHFKGSVEFAEQLLSQARVAVVPGVVFGHEWDGYIRFSFAASYEDIKAGLTEINKYLLSL